MNILRLLALCMSTLSLGCHGCAERSTEESQTPRAPSTGAYVFRTTGEWDKENRYASTVMVSTRSAATGHKECSGVLIAPRLVLTAGHCICARREPAEGGSGGVIDGSACATEAVVVTTLHSSSGKGSKTVTEEYHGAARPHPALEVVLALRGEVTSSRADLALVTLDEPVEGVVPLADLVHEQVEEETPLIIVGHGREEAGGALDGTRRFSRSQIAKVPERDERMFLVPAEGRQDHGSDSGGPCLIEAGQGRILAGISSRGLGNPPACVSLYPHRAWLLAEIERASPSGAPPPPQVPSSDDPAP